MTQSGIRNEKCGPELIGLQNAAEIRWNDDERTLYDLAIARGEGVATANGPLSVTTGKHTGRSATDKYIVKDSETSDTVWWDNNQEMSPEAFGNLHDDFRKHLNGAEVFVHDLYGGADAGNRIKVRIITEFCPSNRPPPNLAYGHAHSHEDLEGEAGPDEEVQFHEHHGENKIAKVTAE